MNLIAWIRLRLNRDLRLCEFPDCDRVFKPNLYGVPYYCPEHDFEGVQL